jgi:peptide/nickel transport system permease protein
MTDAPAAKPIPHDTSGRSQWWDVWDQFKTHKGALFGAAVFLFIVLA